MPRVYFHLFNSGGRFADEEGREVPDLGTARALAMQEIRSILSDEAKQGKVDLRGRIEITGDDDAALGVVLFSDAVDLFLGPGRQ
jgi:hypothetical protein